MANHLQSKISLDFAVDYSSLDSLSFAGLVCIQDQQHKSASTANQTHQHDPEFEFSQSIPTSKPATAPTKNTILNNLLISNGQLLPPPFLSQSKQHHSGSVQATGIDGKRSTEVSDRQHQKQRNQVKEERTATKSWFGQRLFKSFVSPCRVCQAADSTVKAH